MDVRIRVRDWVRISVRGRVIFPFNENLCRSVLGCGSAIFACPVPYLCACLTLNVLMI